MHSHESESQLPILHSQLPFPCSHSRWAVILAFDVTVDRDAQQLADHLGVKIFMADIIYHLFDSFLKHRKVGVDNECWVW